MTKKQVYNGYEEEYLTGRQLKERFLNEYLGVGKHHMQVLGISIKEYLYLIGIKDSKLYRIFVNDTFCRVMNEDDDKCVDFFCHIKLDEIDINKDIVNTKLKIECPICNKTMVLRYGKYGLFLGCKSYPKCRYTQNIPYIGIHNCHK